MSSSLISSCHSGEAGKGPFLEFPLAWCVAFALDLLGYYWTSKSGLQFPSLAWEFCGYFLCFAVLKQSYIWLCEHKSSLAVKAAPSADLIFLGAEYIALSLNVASALCVFSYLFCTLDFALADGALNHIDQAMGFDWMSMARWSMEKPQQFVLFNSYESLLFQEIFLAIWFASLGRRDWMYEIFWIQSLSLLVTVLISGVVPALGPASALGLVEQLYSPAHGQDLSVVAALHAAYTTFAVPAFGGVVAFPSFHTVSAIVYIYAFRKSGIVGYVIFLLNVLMLISIPAYGDHYLVDMFAGLVVALFSIFVVRAWKAKFGMLLPAMAASRAVAAPQ